MKQQSHKECYLDINNLVACNESELNPKIIRQAEEARMQLANKPDSFQPVIKANS